MQRASGLVTLLIGIVASALAFWWLRRPAPPEEEAPPRPPMVVPVTLGEVTRGDLTPVARLTGSVRAPDRAGLAFRAAGTVRAVHAREADAVSAGDLLAELDDAEQRERLAEARAELELAARELARMEAGERSEVIARLESELAIADAELRLAELEVERGEGLLQGSVISASAFDRLRAERDVAQGRLGAARERLAEARAGSRAEDIEVARARLESRRASVATAMVALEHTRLSAPRDGRIAARFLAAGDHAQAGQPVFDLVDTGRVEVELDVPSRLLPNVRVGARLVLRLDERPDFELVTRLDALGPAADPRSRNVRGLVRLESDDPAAAPLLPGVFVRAELDLVTLEDVLLVPEDAVLVARGGFQVVRPMPVEPPAGANSQGPPPPPWEAAWRPIRVLGRHAGLAAVVALEEPLAEGEKVVVTGVDRALPGTPLRPAAQAGQNGPSRGPENGANGSVSDDPASAPTGAAGGDEDRVAGRPAAGGSDGTPRAGGGR